MFSSAWQWAIRVNAFVHKELSETLRQPRLMVTLILGPFLILFVFGAGIRATDPPIRTVFVAPEDSRLATEVEQFAQAQRTRLTVEGVQADEEAALAALRRGELDMVVVFPDEAIETVRSNEHAVVTLYHDQIDPLEGQAVELFARTAVDEINQQVLQAIVAEGQEDAAEVEGRLAETRARVAALEAAMAEGDEAAVQGEQVLLADEVAGLAAVLAPTVGVLNTVGDTVGEEGSDDALLATLADVSTRGEEVTDSSSGEEPDAEEVAALEEDLADLEQRLAEFRGLSPDVIVSPFEDRTQLVVAGGIDLTDFYAPAVVALLLQHLVVTIISLAIVREQALGTTELFQVAPLRPFETVLGKYLAHFLLGAIVTAVLGAVLVVGLGVPVRGSWALLAVTIAALLFAAIGLGFLLALLARSDSQVVQFAMMLLLASVFFSGFVLALERFVPATRVVAWLLPVTYGTELLRDIMLRGQTTQVYLVVALAAIGLALLAVNWVLLRRRVQRT